MAFSPTIATQNYIEWSKTHKKTVSLFLAYWHIEWSKTHTKKPISLSLSLSLSCILAHLTM